VVKPEIRVVGVDDGVFTPHSKGFALIVGVVFRGGYWLDGVMHTRVKVDGMDATRKITSMIVNSPHCKQLRIIMLNGVTCAGFNVIDIEEVSHETRLPVIAVTREKPNLSEIRKVLQNLPQSEKRWIVMRKMGEPLEVCTKSLNAKVYMQMAGICKEDAEKVLQVTSTRSNVPEALRVAHLIASGITAVTV
jgi:endonuclease V-like protein UPF0215 family